VIRAGDRGAVFCESARRAPLAPHAAEERYRVRRGRGRDYVEVDVPVRWVVRGWNPVTRTEEWSVRRAIALDSSATIVRRQ
jgi:hypothetical protein